MTVVECEQLLPPIVQPYHNAVKNGSKDIPDCWNILTTVFVIILAFEYFIACLRVTDRKRV